MGSFSTSNFLVLLPVSWLQPLGSQSLLKNISILSQGTSEEKTWGHLDSSPQIGSKCFAAFVALNTKVKGTTVLLELVVSAWATPSSQEQNLSWVPQRVVSYQPPWLGPVPAHSLPHLRCTEEESLPLGLGLGILSSSPVTPVHRKL